jgi:predicted site-specific integrase-resolvase
MAKPFYTLEEVCAKLGKSADDVKAMVRDGVLREFRDAGKVFFKAEDVNRAASSSDSGEILLEPSEDTPCPPWAIARAAPA